MRKVILGLAIAAVALPAGDMPIFLPFRSASDAIGESCGTTKSSSATCVARMMLIGRPSARTLSALPALAAIAKSIASAAIALVGALTSGNLTYSTSRPRFSMNLPASRYAPNPRLMPELQ